MADNYLENKMEEYRRGVKSAPRRVSPSGNRPGHIDIPLSRLKVLIVGGVTQVGEAVAGAFVSAGCQVACCDLLSDEATGMSRRAGFRFYPVAGISAVTVGGVIDDMIYRWHGIDLMVGIGVDVSPLIAAFADARAANPLSSDYRARVLSVAGDRFEVSLADGMPVFSIPSLPADDRASILRISQLALFCATDPALLLL